MKLSNLKTWLPGMILGLSLLAAVPVSADITNSGSTPPPIKISKLSSTNDVAVDSQNSDDSGKVYDFKDSKTSGVVTVTKNWDDNSSNDKKPVPDVSISTEKPGKNPLGYTITYHGNGSTFADGSLENEIIVNSSGKIVSGQYEELLTSSGWYSDSNCTSKVELNSNGLPVSGVISDLDLYAKPKTYVLKKGYAFNKLISSTATSVIFTDEIMPASATLIDVDADGDSGAVAWIDGTVMKVSTQTPGKQVIAATNCQEMFDSKSNLKSIDFNNLDTSNVTRMSSMFSGCSGLTNLDLTHLDTQKVTDMRYMFYNCSGLTSLDLTHLDTHNVTDMSFMFEGCSGLTNLDLTHLNTQNVTYMNCMFRDCSGLTNLDLTPLDTSKVTDTSAMFYGCSGLTNIDLASLDTSSVTDMGSMFYGCSGLTNLDLASLDTSSVTDMSRMFWNCSEIVSLNLSSFNTEKVTDMGSMFRYCSGLTDLDLSPLNTGNVTDMSYMFDGCPALTTLSIGVKFAFIGSNYQLPSGTWYSSDGTAYTSNGKSCTIPNNKADTYTRK